MRRKSSISNATTYEEMAEYWDTHDASDYWDEVPYTEFDINHESPAMYYPLDMPLAMAMRELAKQRGIPSKTLLAQWVQEKLDAEAARIEAAD